MACIKCPKCGKEISSDKEICDNCGYAFNKDEQLRELEQRAKEQEERAKLAEDKLEQFQKNKKVGVISKKLLIICIAAAIIAIVVISGVIYSTKKNTLFGFNLKRINVSADYQNWKKTLQSLDLRESDIDDSDSEYNTYSNDKFSVADLFSGSAYVMFSKKDGCFKSIIIDEINIKNEKKLLEEINNKLGETVYSSEKCMEWAINDEYCLLLNKNKQGNICSIKTFVLTPTDTSIIDNNEEALNVCSIIYQRLQMTDKTETEVKEKYNILRMNSYDELTYYYEPCNVKLFGCEGYLKYIFSEGKLSRIEFVLNDDTVLEKDVCEKISTLFGEPTDNSDSLVPTYTWSDYLFETEVSTYDAGEKFRIMFSDNTENFMKNNPKYDRDKLLTKKVSSDYISEFDATYQAFFAASHLYKENLEISSVGHYSYNDIPLMSKLVNASSNNELNAGDLFESLGKALKGFYFGGEKLYGNWGEIVVKTVLGIEKKDNWNDMKADIDKAMLIVSDDCPIGEVLSQLSELDTTEGTFDFENKTFDFQITDLKETSKKLGITEEMFGYMLAWLTEFDTKIEFNDNSCSVTLNYPIDNTISQTDLKYKYNDQDEGTDYSWYESGGYKWMGKDVSKADDCYGCVTKRGIQLLDSKNAVILCYGKTEEHEFNYSDDVIYGIFKESDEVDGCNVLESCSSYMIYNKKDEATIIFYFNQEDQVILTFFCKPNPYTDL